MAGGLSFTGAQGNDPARRFAMPPKPEDRMKKTLSIAIALIGVTVATVAIGDSSNPIIVLRQRFLGPNRKKNKNRFLWWSL